MSEEKECMICFGPGRLTMTNVFQVPVTSKDTKQCCKHTYCAPCMEDYLATMSNLFSCAYEGCRAACDTVYALRWLKYRNKHLYEELSLKISKIRIPAKPTKAYFDFDESLTTFIQSSGARQCPGCKHLVERNTGCNQMLCKCGTHFCYCCGYRNGSKESKNYHNNVPQINYNDGCGTCASRHEQEECPIITCSFCQRIGHLFKNCPVKVKACLDCGLYDDHSVSTCLKVLLKKRIKEASEHKVERLKYVGDYIPSNIVISGAEDPFFYDEEEIDNNHYNFVKFNSEPVSLLAFVVSK
eukprot:Awhi_evm2s10256